MGGLEGRFLALIKNLEEEKRLADKRAKQLFDLTKAIQTTAKARAYLSSDQLNIPNETGTPVQLNAETYDPGGNFASYEFTAPVPGYYLIRGQISYKSSSVVADKRYGAFLRVNGASVTAAIAHSSHANTVSVPVMDIRYVAQGETIDLMAYHWAGVGTVDIYGQEWYTFLTIHLISI